MQFTQSPDFVVHGGTGNRMHQDTGPLDTVWSANDANMVIWNLMKLLTDGGISAAAFDPAVPATYNRVSLAVQALVAAGGVTFGALTPELSFGGATTGITYGTQTGTTARVGDMVLFSATIILTNKGSASGDAVVTLDGAPPFLGNTMCPVHINGAAGLTGPLDGITLNGTNDIEIRMFGATGSGGSASDAEFINTTVLVISGWYRTT